MNQVSNPRTAGFRRGWQVPDTPAASHPPLFSRVSSKASPTKEAEHQSLRDTRRTHRSHLSFFIPDLTLGGAEQVTVNLVNGLAARGYNVELLLSRFEGKLTSRLTSGVPVIKLAPSRTPVFGIGMHLPALVSYLRREKPAALFSHMSHASVVCLAANRIIDIDTQVIPTEHKAFGVSPDSTLKSWTVRKLVPYLYPTADRIIAVSEGVATSIVGQTSVEREGVSVLHNPIDIHSVRERAREPVAHEWFNDDELDVLLFVGRIERQKDLETWLRAFERVHDRNRRVRAVIAGEGSRRADLQRLTDRLGIADVVSIPGYVENPYGYMRRASLFLLSSQYEGLPTVLIEALACGCPVVATDCPSGPREILADGAYGNLVPVGDVTGLADAAEEALNDPIHPNKLRERANEFAPEAVLDDYECFITDHIFDSY